MDAASTAFSKILNRGTQATEAQQASPSGGKENTASTQKSTAQPVEHETIQRQHQQREQKVIDKERHQDHYKTTVQPLTEREVKPEHHVHEQAETRHEHHDHSGSHAAQGQQAQFRDERREGGVEREVVKEPTLTSEHVHHHYHETIQPVIEKETVVPSVTHKTIPVKEVHKDPSVDEGITRNEPVSREEFEGRMKQGK
ncbi:hypothetical protein F4861DRAFT_547030 [Xylaria intraflava]|nr:hypothetical protein F4861DRAFT_547030 [Xylaria intraflava]